MSLNLTLSDFVTRLNMEFGLGKWPKTYHVSPELYAKICEAIFKLRMETFAYLRVSDSCNQITIFIGPNGGILYRNIEILIEPEQIEEIP